MKRWLKKWISAIIGMPARSSLLATGCSIQTEFVDPAWRQIELLRDKGCACLVDQSSSD
jgi:hypothetical protein